MSNRGYTTADQVAAYLGVALSVAQEAEATALIGAAEAAIDRYCNRVWAGGPITGEVHVPEGPLLYLRQRPVASIQSVTAGWYFASPAVTLTAGSDYLVRDLTQGLLLLTPWRAGRPTDRPYETVSVAYTPVAAVPAEVALAATMLVASWLQAALGGGVTAPHTPVVRERVGDVDVQYAAPAAAPAGDVAWPPAVLALLASYRAAPVIV